MTKREEAVTRMQVSLLPMLMKHWNVNLIKLRDIFKEYEVLEYIGVCYEYYNSMGTQGIIEDIEGFIHDQGGEVQCFCTTEQQKNSIP